MDGKRALPALAQGDCHVWWAAPGDAGLRAAALLSAVERDRMAVLRRAEDRARFVAACALLRLAVAAYTGGAPHGVTIDRSCQSCARQHGRPRLVAAPLPLELSVSHSGGQVAVAVALGAPVGVDVEELRADLVSDGLVGSMLAPDERQALLAAPPAEWPSLLLTSWTMKEAVLKAVGTGLRVEPASFSVSAPNEPPRLLRWPREPALAERLTLHALRPRPGHVAHVAVVGGSGRVTELDGSAMLRRWQAQA